MTASATQADRNTLTELFEFNISFVICAVIGETD
jgi:hypothetical protein